MCIVILVHSMSSENLHDVAHIQGKMIPWMPVDSISADQ